MLKSTEAIIGVLLILSLYFMLNQESHINLNAEEVPKYLDEKYFYKSLFNGIFGKKIISLRERIRFYFSSPYSEFLIDNLGFLQPNSGYIKNTLYEEDFLISNDLDEKVKDYRVNLNFIIPKKDLNNDNIYEPIDIDSLAVIVDGNLVNFKKDVTEYFDEYLVNIEFNIDLEPKSTKYVRIIYVVGDALG